MIIKVCGMCHGENLSQLVRLDINWVGMIFHESSSRHVEADLAAAENLRLLRISDFGIEKVGVFVDAKSSTILEKKRIYNLSFVQLHGKEAPAFCENLNNLGLKVIKAFSVDDTFDFSQLKEYAVYCEYFLFDTKGELPGGNGYTFNWEILKKYNLDTPFILSGGIGLDQLDDLKLFKHPKWSGIDLNSKFESEPGLKDIDKVKDFIASFDHEIINN